MHANYDIEPGHPLRKLFGGLIDNVFVEELGIADPQLRDYLAQLLADFVHVDRIYRMQNVDGERIRELSRIEAEAFLGVDVPPTRRTCLINRYIGDFTLFWTGVYPEALRPRRGPDRLTQYLQQGKRGYGIAGELSEHESIPPGELLQQLSREFEACVHGLHLVRNEWERLGSPFDQN